MIRDDAKIILTPTGIIDEALSDEYLEKLNEEARLYRSNEHIPENHFHPSGKESRRTRRMLELRKRKGRL